MPPNNGIAIMRIFQNPLVKNETYNTETSGSLSFMHSQSENRSCVYGSQAVISLLVTSKAKDQFPLPSGKVVKQRQSGVL